jgi:hypothetical protein
MHRTTIVGSLAILVAGLALVRCPSRSGPGAASPDPQTSAAHAAAATNAVGELQEGRFESARDVASEVLGGDAGNAYARAVRAIAEYRLAARDLHTAFLALFGRLLQTDRVDYRPFRTALDRAEQALGKVEDDLAAAAVDRNFSLELCLACWRADWNQSGSIDESDELLFQLEVDANLEPLPENDPRRKPTFRFDVGDLHWAHAMVAFQRAAIDLLLAYSWDVVDQLLEADGDELEHATLTIRLQDAGRVHAARERLLAGLDAADRAREEYLAETDDDREWVPNPSQHDHPLPLPVDQALYDTWERVVRDVRSLVHGEEGIDVAQVAQLGEFGWDDPPHGFIDIGKLLEDPADIVLSMPHIDKFENRPTRANAETLLRDLLGDAYVTEMAASGLPLELDRMKNEIDDGADSLECKLRYLLWIN